MDNLDLRIAGKYRLKRKIASGGWGVVYLATDLDSKEDVAVKLEHMFNESLLLSNEANVYRHISGGVGIPRVHWYGSECEYYALVLELLGPSLEDLLYFCGGKLSLKTTLMLFDQLICRLRYIHSKKILHRDIKPENFLMGTGKRGNQVFVTDPGLATHYVASDRVDPMPRPENPQGLGTPYYSSINGQLGIPQSYRDDLEALGFVVVYLLRGTLPWPTGNDLESIAKVLNVKETISVEDFCQGLPKEIATYLKYVKSLRDGEKPNYSYLRRLFQGLFKREGFEYDYVFDWTILKYRMTVP